MLRRAIYVTLAMSVFLLPLAIVSVLLLIKFNATLFDHVPFYSDELYHWHQSVTFAAVGFDGGYYSLNENIPIADFSHFYAWGAWAYTIYGSIGRLFGLPLHAIATINLVLFWIAGAIYTAVARPSHLSLILTGVVLGTFIPLLLYLPSSMLQVMHLAFALVIAAAFYRLLTQPIRWQSVAVLAVFITLIGLIRPTYALYLPPMFALAFKNRTFRTTILSGFMALPLVVVAAVGYYVTSAPYPFSRNLLFFGDQSLMTKVSNFIAYGLQSFVWMTDGAAVVMAQRLQILVLIVLLIGWGLYRWRSAKNQDDDGQWQWELALHLYNLVGFYTATIFFHETLGGHDYRVMAPHFLVSLLLLVLLRRRVVLGGIIVMSLFWLGHVNDEYNYKAPNFADTVPRQFADWRSIMGDDLQYNPDADPWCNTVITSSFYVLDVAGTPGMLLSIDPGMGLSWARDWEFPNFDLPVPAEYQTPETFQSRYLILTDDDYERFGQFLNLERLDRAPQGALYFNTSVDCDTDAATP